MDNDRFVTDENGKRYTRIENVGRGAIATVWKAQREDQSLVAVKVPLRALNPDLRRQFDTEVETLQKILALDVLWPAGANLPPVSSFALRGEPDALVLEWIDVPTLASKIQGEINPKDRQKQVIEPAYQYVWFMDILHNRLGIGQHDRKLGDLYWDQENKRLVVLDWNVVSGADRAAEDIYKFGEMWYALLLGKLPVLGADLAANVGWERLSAAWRSVLSICLYPDRTARPNASQLLDIISDLRDDYGKDPGTLLQEGQRELEEATSRLGTTEGRADPSAWALVDGARLKLDLAHQMGHDEGAQLAAQAQEVLDQRGHAALKDVKSSLELSRSDDALKALTQAEAELGHDPEGRLRVARWRCLYDAWQASRQEGLAPNLREQMIRLASFVEGLEKGEWSASKVPLSATLRELDGSHTYELLIGLEAELDLRRLLREAPDEIEEGLYREASARYGKAQELLQKVAYGDALAATIVNLNDAQAECEHLARTEGRLQEILLEELPQAIAETEYGSAHRLYNEALPLTGADPEARQELNNAFARVQGLEALEQARQQGDVPEKELIRQAHDLLNQFPGDGVVLRAAGQVVTRLLPGLERQAESAKRPTDLEAALDLGRPLQGLSESSKLASVDPLSADRCQRVVETLERKLTLQRELRSLYEQGDSQAQQQAIHRAEQGGIELYDDLNLSLVRLRDRGQQEREFYDAARMAKDYDHQRPRLEKIRAEIDGFIKQYERVNVLIGEVGQMLSAERREKFESKLGELESLTDRAQRVKEEFEETDLDVYLAPRQDLIRRADAQRRLDQTIVALRQFKPDDAQYHLGRLKTAIEEHLPQEAREGYQGWITFLDREWKVLSRLENEELDLLRTCRAGLDGNTARRDEIIGRLQSLELDQKIASSAFIAELWNLARAGDEEISALYNQAQAEVHNQFVGSLSAQKLNELEQQIDTFDGKWRERVKIVDDGTVLRHTEFICAWSNRLMQAQASKDQLDDLERFLQRPGYTGYNLKELYERQRSIEHVILYTPNEVFCTLAERWEELVRQLLLQLQLQLGSFGTRRAALEDTWPILTIMRDKSRKGQRYFSMTTTPVEEDE